MTIRVALVCVSLFMAGCAAPEPAPEPAPKPAPKPTAKVPVAERLKTIEFVIPEFASPFTHGQSPVDPELAKALLVHVKVGQHYVYRIRTGRHEMTRVQEVVSIGGPEVRFVEKYTNDSGMAPIREEQGWRVPGELIARVPPLRTDFMWIAGLGELECLVWVMGELEIWVASVDGKPTFPGLVKMGSPGNTQLRLVWVGAGR